MRKITYALQRFWKNRIPKGKVWFFASALFLLIAAPALNWYIQYSTATASAPHAIEFISEHPVLFAFGSLILFLIFVLIWAVCGNAFLSAGITASLITVLMFADRAKFEIRLEHVIPDDLANIFNAGDILTMYDKWAMIRDGRIILVFLGVGILAVVLRRLYNKKKYPPISGKLRGHALLDVGKAAYGRLEQKLKEPDSKRVINDALSYEKPHKIGFLPRVCVIFVVLALLFCLTIPMRNSMPQIVYAIDYEEIAWNQIQNFDRNGFVMGFINNIKHYVMEEPEQYSEESIAQIVKQYTKVAEAKNSGRVNLADAGIDVLFVMNESFCDPDLFTEQYPYTGDDVVPNLHRIEQEAASGKILSPRYGGGTSHVEFEALTGLSLFFLGSCVPFQSIVAPQDDFPSVARFLKNNAGYETLGLHSYGPTMYRRHAAYPSMGFDAFYGNVAYTHNAHDMHTWYISDASSYAELFDRLTDDPDSGSDDRNKFITLVTMQNHAQYGHQYSFHNFHSEAPILDSENLKIDDYLELLHSSDEALGALIEEIDARDEKTVLVFWGDHLPGLYNNLLKSGRPATAYETPFFIYANFETALDAQPLGVLSPNYIRTVTMDRIGAEKSPFDYLLDDVMTDAPNLTLEFYEGEETEAISDYRLIEYDVVSGEGYAADLGFFDLP
ncbi:MAG: sulfatase-like hydrolase/transferase [Clostridiales Family XIII bacterium]|jgi:hypothetical protein|nr:sulfatase-like hydrolase/transferase [Clostridiales Family XIII bacterium]